MTPGHRRTIQNALLSVQERRRELESALLDAPHVSLAYPVQELWNTRLAENLVTIAEFVETGSRLESVTSALQQVFHLLYSNPLNPEEYLLPDGFHTSDLGSLLLEAQLRLIVSLLTQQEGMGVEDAQAGNNQTPASLMYNFDALQHAYTFIDMPGVGSCLQPFARLVLTLHQRKVDRIHTMDIRFLFFGTAQLWMELFLFVAKRRQILVVETRSNTTFDLREGLHEARFRRKGESTQA
jgi:hypothetical protein